MPKLFVNTCKHCARKFPTRFENQEYCGKKCRAEARRQRDEECGQICWNCQNAVCKCSWSQSFIPVPGWNANRITIRGDGDDIIDTYDIISCPQFIHD